MAEVKLEGLAETVDEATLQSWFIEEGDRVSEGDNLVKLSTEQGIVTIQSPVSGILAEAYYDEGELVAKGDVLCVIDEEELPKKEAEEEEEESD